MVNPPPNDRELAIPIAGVDFTYRRPRVCGELDHGPPPVELCESAASLWRDQVGFWRDVRLITLTPPVAFVAQSPMAKRTGAPSVPSKRLRRGRYEFLEQQGRRPALRRARRCELARAANDRLLPTPAAIDRKRDRRALSHRIRTDLEAQSASGSSRTEFGNRMPGRPRAGRACVSVATRTPRARADHRQRYRLVS